MAQKVFKAVLKTRYDTAANFSAKNPILAEGEKATESDTHKSKTGDGTTEYNSLSYDKADVSYNDLSDKPTIPTKTSQLTNDSGFLTSHQDLTQYAKKTDVPAVTVSGNTISFGSVTIGVD